MPAIFNAQLSEYGAYYQVNNVFFTEKMTMLFLFQTYFISKQAALHDHTPVFNLCAGLLNMRICYYRRMRSKVLVI